MIIFGTKTKLLSNSPENFLGDCNYCHTPKSLFAHKAINYFHIFWIPVFPYSFDIITICGHCKRVSYQPEIDSQTLGKIRVNGMPKTPKKYFAGILLIGFLFVAFIIAEIYSSGKTTNYLKNPRIGDVYKIKLDVDDKPIYTLYRIANVTTDSVTFEMNDYEGTDRKSFRKLQEQHSNSYSKIIVLSRGEVQEMNEENQISSIKRE